MNSNEIKKALDSYKKDIGCAKCGFEDKYLLTIFENTLDLINQYEAETKNLEIELKAMRGAANSYKLHYEQAKAEAIKEFAEECKKRTRMDYLIDELLKEMGFE